MLKANAASSNSMNYIHVYENEDCMVTAFTRWGGNNPTYILESVTEAFDVRIVSEYEPEYHGFDTQEEWDAFEDALACKFADEFYADLNSIREGGAQRYSSRNNRSHTSQDGEGVNR